MQVALLVLSGMLLLSGLALRLITGRHKSELGRSVRWYEVKYWFVPWRAVDLLSEKGLRLHVTSVALLCSGLVLYLLASGISLL